MVVYVVESFLDYLNDVLALLPNDAGLISTSIPVHELEMTSAT